MSSDKINQLHILMVQQNYTVGAIQNNASQIISVIQEHQEKQQNKPDIIIFPELAITGYPPEDWLFRADFYHRVDEALRKIQAITKNVYVVIGHPVFHQSKCFNRLSVLHQGKRVTYYDKHHLPNYGVFDEKRYFAPGKKSCVFSVKGKKIGLLICEDLWQPGPWQNTVEAGAELILSSNASPFDWEKLSERENIIRQRQSMEGAVPFIYVNMVGGQDELIFDGQSFVMNEKGEVCFRAQAYESEQMLVSIALEKEMTPNKVHIAHLLNKEALIYKALVLGTRDYIHKNGFKGALVGLSGGIDSALTLAIAVDALGADCVEAVMMPSRYTASISREDAIAEIQALNVRFREIAIEPLVEAFSLGLTEDMMQKKITKENLQARCRGVLLMALSNETGRLVLTTGNKSEMAVGYCTLYGDMCGGFAVLKDVLKTEVYRLAHYRNSISKFPIIPQRVIERAPSAELAFDQKDQDSLPPYEVLDTIIEQYVERNQSADEVIAAGIEAAIVHKMIQLFHLNEYKRRQAAPGPKITRRAFGRDWRYPITYRQEIKS